MKINKIDWLKTTTCNKYRLSIEGELHVHKTV